MVQINFGKPVFEGENIIAIDHDTYIVFDKETGQGEFVIPSIESYKLEDGIRVATPVGDQSFKIDLYCPNMEKLNHDKNQWARVDEHTITCSECSALMDIKDPQGRARLEEAK